MTNKSRCLFVSCAPSTTISTNIAAENQDNSSSLIPPSTQARVLCWQSLKQRPTPFKILNPFN